MFKFSQKNEAFKVRSASRDSESDATRMKLVTDVLERVLSDAHLEQVGLQDRLKNVLARASMTIGNDPDEYLTRDKTKDAEQSAQNADIRYAERRLGELLRQIERYKALLQLCSDDQMSKSFFDLQSLMKSSRG